MKPACLLFSPLLAALTLGGSAHAQELTPAAAPPDTIYGERVAAPAPRPALVTAADSARERARQENARRLRQTGRNNPAHGPKLPPPGSPAQRVLTAPDTRAAAAADPKALEKAARSREEAARQAAENERKREKALYKRARKDS